MSDLSLQSLSTVQSNLQPFPLTIPSASAIAPTTFMTFITGTIPISTIVPPVSGTHLLTLIFTNPTPGGLVAGTGVGQFKTNISAAQNVPVLLIYDPVSTLYWSFTGISNTSVGTGAIVLQNSPTLVTPNIGAAIASSINGIGIAGAAGRTLTVNNSITLAGVDNTVMTFPSTSATIARTDAANSFTGTQTFGAIVFNTLNGNTWATGTGTLSIAAGKTLTASNSLTFAGTDATTITFQGTDTYVGRATTDTLTNKTLSAPILSGTATGTYTLGGTPTIATPTITGTTTAAAIASSGAITSSSATGGIGYATGAGGAVTQATSKSTGVTLNTASGAITMNGAALGATTSVAFTLTNSVIAARDVVIVNLQSVNSANSYFVSVDAVAAGSCSISLRNYTAGSLSEAVVLNFAVIKAVNA